MGIDETGLCGLRETNVLTAVAIVIVTDTMIKTVVVTGTKVLTEIGIPVTFPEARILTMRATLGEDQDQDTAVTDLS